MPFACRLQANFVLTEVKAKSAANWLKIVVASHKIDNNYQIDLNNRLLLLISAR
jgi:hypothetical protein